MKAITLWQPWASLVALGIKRYETRSWAPPDALIGQRLAIHAAKRTPRQPVEEFLQAIRNSEKGHDQIWTVLGYPCMQTFENLPRGCVLCVKELVSVWSTDRPLPSDCSGREAVYGDLSPGRYAWKLKWVEFFRPPIPARGGQRIWNWDEEASDDERNHQ